LKDTLTGGEEETMQLSRIQHEGVPIKDLGRSLAFYEGVLGLHTLPRPDFGAGGAWLCDANGVPQIHLILSNAAVPGPDAKPDPTARHTAFLVDDYEGLKRRFQEHGVRCIEAAQSPAGVAQLTCVDPDGHTLEFQPAAHYGDKIYTPGFEPDGA
jgi:catechol 2,3-dioxygenase-like lactoylglutathione lyase family enzyme